jgi:hypothetical protein
MSNRELKNAITNIGVQPNENTTMNKKMNVMPALERAAFPSWLDNAVTMAKITVIAAVA